MICIKCRNKSHKECKTWPAYAKPKKKNQNLKTWCDCKHLPEDYSQE